MTDKATCFQNTIECLDLKNEIEELIKNYRLIRQT